MGIQIEDGTGQGYQTGVSVDNRILIESAAYEFIHLINHKYGQAYSLTFTVTPTGANDCFCYIKNTSTTDINLQAIILAAASDDVVQLKVKDTGTPVGGTTATPVNFNTTSGNTATGTFQTGVDITGLSGGSVIDQFFVDGAIESMRYTWPSTIVIGQNQTATLYAVTGGIALRISIYFFYHSVT